MRRGTWFNTFAAERKVLDFPPRTREELASLDNTLFAIWNLGNNVLLGWTHSASELLFLSIRHYAIPESVHAGAGNNGGTRDATRFINDVLSGPKYLEPKEFKRVSEAFNCRPHAVHVNFRIEDERLAALISDMVRCYGVSLVRNRAVVLLDAVEFSLQSPLDQMAMLNSLAYSVNSAYGQILLGDFLTEVGGNAGGRTMRYDTLEFVENTAATLDQLNGLDISGSRIENIRCYLTGRSLGGAHYLVDRYHVRDKHGTMRAVYNAKINIHRDKAEPIFLGIRNDDLRALTALQVESLSRDAAAT